MSESSKSELLVSQLEIVEQAKTFLTQVSWEQYNFVASPHFTSSAGKHMRHIVDHYFAVIKGLETKFIDYDDRSRGADIETDLEAALGCWQQIEEWLYKVCHNADSVIVDVKTEVSINHQTSMQCQSTLARELVFVASHAVHHFSLMSVISSLQGLELPASFGVAPATASHLRILPS